MFLVGFTFMYFLAYVLQAQWGSAQFGIVFSRMHIRNFNVQACKSRISVVKLQHYNSIQI